MIPDEPDYKGDAKQQNAVQPIFKQMDGIYKSGIAIGVALIALVVGVYVSMKRSRSSNSETSRLLDRNKSVISYSR